MLSWLEHSFGVKKAIVALDPSKSSFTPVALKRFPLSVQIVPVPNNPMPHAKFVWLEGRSGQRR